MQHGANMAKVEHIGHHTRNKQEEAMDDSQPIATAPKDGSTVGLFWPHPDPTKIGEFTRGHWIAAENRWWTPEPKPGRSPIYWRLLDV